MNREIILILCDIRSVYNVGALFRTADAVAVKEIFLGGVTPTPIDRFGRARKDFAKTALGAEKIVPWRYCESLERAIVELKAEGVEVVALEQDKRAVDYRKGEFGKRVALVLGSEVGGIPQNILDLSDQVIEIPMLGHKESLNVSVAGGVALYALREASR